MQGRGVLVLLLLSSSLPALAPSAAAASPVAGVDVTLLAVEELAYDLRVVLRLHPGSNETAFLRVSTGEASFSLPADVPARADGVGNASISDGRRFPWTRTWDGENLTYEVSAWTWTATSRTATVSASGRTPGTTKDSVAFTTAYAPGPTAGRIGRVMASRSILDVTLATINLTWEPPTDPGSRPVVGYEVAMFHQSGWLYGRWHLARNTSEHRNLDPRAAYFFEIRPITFAGFGEMARFCVPASTTGTMRREPCPPPQGLSERTIVAERAAAPGKEVTTPPVDEDVARVRGERGADDGRFYHLRADALGRQTPTLTVYTAGALWDTVDVDVADVPAQRAEVGETDVTADARTRWVPGGGWTCFQMTGPAGGCTFTVPVSGNALLVAHARGRVAGSAVDEWLVVPWAGQVGEVLP